MKLLILRIECDEDWGLECRNIKGTYDPKKNIIHKQEGIDILLLGNNGDKNKICGTKLEREKKKEGKE